MHDHLSRYFLVKTPKINNIITAGTGYLSVIAAYFGMDYKDTDRYSSVRAGRQNTICCASSRSKYFGARALSKKHISTTAIA